MKLLTLTLFTLILTLTASIRILKGDQITKDNSLGRIIHFAFTADGRLFFQAVNQTFGFIDGKTGKITSLFILEKDEKVIEVQGQD